MVGALKYMLKELKKRVPHEYHSIIKVFIKEEAN
jgi:hypothetical protein